MAGACSFARQVHADTFRRGDKWMQTSPRWGWGHWGGAAAPP